MLSRWLVLKMAEKISLNLMAHQELIKMQIWHITCRHGIMMMMNEVCSANCSTVYDKLCMIHQDIHHKTGEIHWGCSRILVCLTSILVNIHDAQSGPWFNIKMSSYQYWKSHCGDKTVIRSSYLHNEIPYIGKMASLYWISPQKVMMTSLYRYVPCITGPFSGETTLASLHLISPATQLFVQ